ncbi:proton-coupled folate transporter-like [Amphiura filiformis]|uniref:proton-coupled folate transporter-like n=1 Tax=Amphiura filiformis TaxID=82378 RepID=UPI003B21D013
MQSQPLSRRLITVEPVVFCVEAIQGILINLRTEYIEYRLAAQHNYTIPNVGSGNSSCWLNETNSTTSHIQEEIEADTAIWILYMKDTSVFLPIITATILAATSDFIGRRPIFFIGSLCHLLASCLFLLVSIFNLPIWVLICGEVILGLGGDSVLIDVVALAYIVDIYRNDTQQPFRLVVVSMITYIAFGISQIIIGQILQLTNSFIISFSCAVGLAILNLLYVCIPYFIPETISGTRVPKDLVKQIFVKYYKLFHKDHTSNKNPVALVVTFISDFFYYFVHEAIFVVITIYGIAAPFCWTPTETGIYAAMVNMVPALSSLVAAKILSICLNNFWMLHVSLIGAISELLITAWARTSVVLLYAAPAAGFIRTLAEGIYKAQLATLVNQDEQGVLFGVQALVASIGKVCSPILLNSTYAAFVKIGKPQWTFFMSAGLLGVPMFLNGILHIMTMRGRGTSRDAPLLEEEPETDDGHSVNS